MKSSLISRQADKYLNGQYHLGNTSMGWDCISLILDFYRTFGFEFPVEFEGITEENYPEMWRKEPQKTRKILERFLLGIGTPIEKNFFVRGDLLLFRGKEIPVFAAIYLGNDIMKMVFKEGVVEVPFHLFEKFYIGARRLL